MYTIHHLTLRGFGGWMEQFVAMRLALGAAMREDRLVRRTLAGWCELLGSRLRANQLRSAAAAHWAVAAPTIALRRWRSHAQVPMPSGHALAQLSHSS